MVLLKVAVLQSCSITSSTAVGTVKTIDDACSQNLLGLSKTTRSLFESFGEFFCCYCFFVLLGSVQRGVVFSMLVLYLLSKGQYSASSARLGEII